MYPEFVQTDAIPKNFSVGKKRKKRGEIKTGKLNETRRRRSLCAFSLFKRDENGVHCPLSSVFCGVWILRNLCGKVSKLLQFVVLTNDVDTQVKTLYIYIYTVQGHTHCFYCKSYKQATPQSPAVCW